MAEDFSPMMQNYLNTKEQYKDCESYSKNGKEAIIRFSKWTLTEEMVGDTVYGDMSFKEYIKESFK